jgi:hypothetical protein
MRTENNEYEIKIKEKIKQKNFCIVGVKGQDRLLQCRGKQCKEECSDKSARDNVGSASQDKKNRNRAFLLVDFSASEDTSRTGHHQHTYCIMVNLRKSRTNTALLLILSVLCLLAVLQVRFITAIPSIDEKAMQFRNDTGDSHASPLFPSNEPDIANIRCQSNQFLQMYLWTKIQDPSFTPG